MEDTTHKLWSGKTGGRPWMQRSLTFCFRIVGMRIPYCIMGLVVPFYMVFHHQGYLAMYHFFRERFAFSPLKSFRYVYLNHFKFGQIILDRFAVYAGRTFSIEIDGNDLFKNLVSQKEGFLQLSSHVGNYELAGYSLVAEEKTFNALVFSGETKSVMLNRERILTKNNIKMVQVKEDLSHVFILNSALENGEIVSMSGDRIFGSSRYVECPFFGQNAKFPLGPFALAVQRDVKILAVFVMKDSSKNYKIFIRKVDINSDGLSRKEKMEGLARAFAAELEKVIRLYPVQWFNFYDFWR